MPARIAVNQEKVAGFCRRWKIVEMAFFGSVLRDDFGPDSDVDILVAFDSSARWSIFDIMAMEEELSEVFGRKVDLVCRKAIERSPNWIRRKAILGGAEPIYAQG